VLPLLDETLMYPILALDGFEALEILVYGGHLPIELGALSNLNRLSVFYYCLTGGLPPNLLFGLQKAWLVWIGKFVDAEWYQPQGAKCGIAGPIPDQWFEMDASSAVKPGTDLQVLELSNNKLTGTLPDISNWTSLQMLFLSNNEFNGKVRVC
jgi:hypothetical protein